MTERDALLKAVCDHPNDDTPRLVFADWLQENDEEARAEFIRVQIEIARFANPPKKLAKRAGQLLRRHGPRWSFDLHEQDGFLWAQSYSRGFIEEVVVSDAARFLRCAANCFDSTPIVTLSVYCSALDWQALFDAGHLSRIRHLRLGVSDIGAHAETLCAIGPWPNLKELTANQTLVQTSLGYEDRGAASHAALRRVFGEDVYLLYVPL